MSDVNPYENTLKTLLILTGSKKETVVLNKMWL